MRENYRGWQDEEGLCHLTAQPGIKLDPLRVWPPNRLPVSEHYIRHCVTREFRFRKSEMARGLSRHSATSFETKSSKVKVERSSYTAPSRLAACTSCLLQLVHHVTTTLVTSTERHIPFLLSLFSLTSFPPSNFHPVLAVDPSFISRIGQPTFPLSGNQPVKMQQTSTHFRSVFPK